jgi:serine/threonine protein kinase
MSADKAAESGDVKTAPSAPLKGRYRIIGAGVRSGQAVSYAAEDLASDRAVTVAVFRADETADSRFLAAVRERAHRLANPLCVHPALVRVYDADVTGGGEPFVVLETVVGRSLRAMLDECGRLSMAEALRLAIQVGEGVETLHANGIVHGALRPESVVIVKGEDGRDAVKLVGVEMVTARRIAGESTEPDTTRQAYLPPEQVDDDEASEAADVFGLGVLLHEMLTGQPPSNGGAETTQLPPSVEHIIVKALERAPKRRYSSISFMVNEMWSAQSAPTHSHSHAPTAVSSVAASESRPARRGRRHSDVGMATALVVCLLLIGVTAWVVRSEWLTERSRVPAEPVAAAAPASPAAQVVTPTPVPTIPASQQRPQPKTPSLPTIASPSEAAAPPPSIMDGQTRSRSVTPEIQDAAKPATVSAVRAPRPAARLSERPLRMEQPSADGADGTAIIDWLLKNGR